MIGVLYEKLNRETGVCFAHLSSSSRVVVTFSTKRSSYSSSRSSSRNAQQIYTAGEWEIISAAAQ
jgi:hypothetical protein